MKKHFIVNKEHLYLKNDNKSIYLSDEELKDFINKNLLHCIREVPFKYEVGDYVTCVEPLSNFYIEDHLINSINAEGRGCYKKGITFRVGRINKGLGIFPDDGSLIRGGGVFVNWLRPATDEEIKQYKNLVSEQEIKFYNILAGAC